MITPPYLQHGDKVGLFAPARKISVEELLVAKHLLERWGLVVVHSPNLFGNDHQFSGTDEQRTEDLQTLINTPDIKALIAVRGGYGTSKIVDHIDFDPLIQSPKWLVGFSDITVLHNHLHNLQLATIHGNMPILFGRDEETDESLRVALFGEAVSYTVSTHAFNREGKAKAPIVGGNLSVFANMIGTPSDIDTTGKILFLEDLDEYLYHVDRMMVQLRRAGKLDQLAGLVIGGMSDMNDNEIPFGKTAYEIIRDVVSNYAFPVCFGFPAGHELKNLALILGKEVNFEVNKEKVTLSC